jgi:predicted dinucleotide-binding enzyme
MLKAEGIGAFEMTKPTEEETIAIIGTGDLAQSFGRRFAHHGYPVV